MKDLRIRARSVVFNFHVRSYTLLELKQKYTTSRVEANSNATALTCWQIFIYLAKEYVCNFIRKQHLCSSCTETLFLLASLLFLSSGDWIQIEILFQTGLVFISLACLLCTFLSEYILSTIPQKLWCYNVKNTNAFKAKGNYSVMDTEKTLQVKFFKNRSMLAYF